jgi:hypothetical protein
MSPTASENLVDEPAALRRGGEPRRHRKRFRLGFRRGAGDRRADMPNEPRRTGTHAIREPASPNPRPSSRLNTAQADLGDHDAARRVSAPITSLGRTAAGPNSAATRGPGIGSGSGAHGIAGDTVTDLLPAVLGSLAMRELALAESLIQHIEGAERKEDDPDALAFLYRIDHLATRLRRGCENLLVLAGLDGADPRLEPTPLLDVVRAAISEIKHYDRVKIEALPRTAVLGLASDDLSHLLAELLDNAIARSPRDAPVIVRGRPGNGALIVMVDDSGIGIAPERLAKLNARLASQVNLDVSVTRHMGLYVVSQLARRHGVYVQLQARPGNGTCVQVIVPHRLLQPMAPLRAPRASTIRGVAAGRDAPRSGERGMPSDAPAARQPTRANGTTRPRGAESRDPVAGFGESGGPRDTPLPRRSVASDRPTINRPAPPIASAPNAVPGLPPVVDVKPGDDMTSVDGRSAHGITPDLGQLNGSAPAAGPEQPAAPPSRTAGGLPRRVATQRAPWQTAGFALPRHGAPARRTAADAARYIHDQLDAFELGQHAARHDLTRRDTSEPHDGVANPLGTE